MVDAESKIKTDVKRKRIRHAYSRKELYHRWIHSSEYVYVSGTCQISGKYNYLFLGDIGKNTPIYVVESRVGFSDRPFAVIDRDTNRILISDKYPSFAWELICSLPDEYKVFRCHGGIPCHDILSDEHIELLCKKHLEYVIRDYTSKYLYPYYAVLEGKSVLHSDITNNITKEAINSCIVINKNYDDILTFIKKYKIKKYDWYNKTLDPNYKLNIYYPNCYDTVKIALPTVKQLVTGTIFNKKQIELFKKRYFYTKYCYGRGIKFKDVEKYWNKTVYPLDTAFTNDNISYDLTYNQIKKFLQINKVYWTDNFYNNKLVTWNDYIILTKEIEDNITAKCIKENIEKSKQNELKAREELKEYVGNDYLKRWRDNKGLSVRNYVEYRKFITPNRKNKYGSWITEKLYLKFSNVFDNIQLKLYNNTIITSNNASVSIDDAIKCYKLLQVCKEKYDKDGQNIFSFVKQNIHIGIYNLIEISYIHKYKDNGDLLPVTTWLIRIGCHKIWLDDFEDFVSYYHLEEKFGIKCNNENKQIKLKIK